MDLASIKSALWKANVETLFSDSGDVETLIVQTLICIIKMTGHEKTLFHIIKSTEDRETLDDLMESGGDVDTLIVITEIIADVEDPNMFNSGRKDQNLFNSGRTFSQNELDTALLFFCLHGYTFLVLELFHLGADMQARDKNGNTPLLICAENGFTNIARLFITREVNINTANDFGDTALILASGLAGSVEMVKLLLAQTGINKNHQNKQGCTALMKAVEDWQLNVIELLLDSHENTIEGLETKNHRSETTQDIADKSEIGTNVRLLIKDRTKMHYLLLAAVLTCDMDSFNIMMDCHVYEPSYKKQIIQDSFKAMFKKHKKSGENFSENEEKIIQKLLENGAEVDDCPIFGPLRIATNVGSCNVLTMLLNHQANLNILYNWTQEYLLAVTAERGHVNIVELLLKRNRNLAAEIITTRALGNARKNGHLGCVEMLTKHGASLIVKSDFESAVKINDPVELKYLVENCAVEINDTVSAEAMNNFVVAAARSGHTEIIGILLDAGANVNCVNSYEKTPLMEAKNAAVVNFLVQRGAVVNMNITAHDKVYSPLQYVLSEYYDHYDLIKRVEIVKALLKHGASVNENSHIGSPLMIAVLNTSKEIVQLLLDNGADVSIQDSSGSTVLHLAAQNYFVENFECLLQHSEVRNIINEKNHAGITALIISTMYDHSAVKALIDHGADVNMKDMDGNNALMYVACTKRRNTETLTTLIQAGSDINCQNDSGYSALMLAAQVPWKDAMVLLIDSGADLNTVSGKNETALLLVLNTGYYRSHFVEYLLDRGARASYAEQKYILWLILKRQLHIIPKLMQCGLGPAEITLFYKPCSNLPTSVNSVSPLYMALMTGNAKLANYFVENLFVTKSDMFMLIYNKDVRHYFHRLKLHECLGFLDKQSAQPLSLFSLACLEVQSAVSTAPGREERITLLPLPLLIKDRLMFKVESGHLDLLDLTSATYVEECECLRNAMYK